MLSRFKTVLGAAKRGLRRRRVRYPLYAVTVLGIIAWCAAAVFLAQTIRRARVFGNPPVRQATPAKAGWAYEDMTVSAADGVEIRGWFIPHPAAQGRTVLLAHGKGG